MLAISLSQDVLRLTLHTDHIAADGKTVNRVVIGRLSMTPAGFVDLYNQDDRSGARLKKAGEVHQVESTTTTIVIGMFTKPKSDELRRVFMGAGAIFLTAAVFSLAINLLYLAAPLYMLQVYDRVVPSGSGVTLVMLTVALLLALGALAALDSVRARVLTRASIRLDKLLAGRVVAATVETSARTGGSQSVSARF